MREEARGLEAIAPLPPHLGNTRLNPRTNDIPVSGCEKGVKDSEALGPDGARETC